MTEATLNPNTKIAQIKAVGNTHDVVLELVLGSGGRILDCAAGAGQVTARLRERGWEVTPADIDVVENAPLDGLVVADFNAGLPFESQAFDGVVSVETIEHLENPWHFVREASRVVRRGGFVVITTPNVGSVFSRVLHFLCGRPLWFREDDLRRLGHITPIYRHLLIDMAKRADLQLDQMRFSKGRVPIAGVPLPVSGSIFGETLIARFRRL